MTTIWYDPETGQIEFAITDRILGDRVELDQLWPSPRAKQLRKMTIPNKPPGSLRRYRVTPDGNLEPLQLPYLIRGHLLIAGVADREFDARSGRS